MSEVDQAFQDTLHETATSLAGDQAATLVTPAFESTLTDFFVSLLSSCMGGGTPTPSPTPVTPVTSTQVATQMKGAGPLQQSVLRNRGKRYFVQHGMTKQHGLLGANTLIQASAATPVEQLTTVIDHVNNSFPEMDMF